MQVAIDPGLAAMGVVAWRKLKKGTISKTFRPSKRSDPVEDRRREQVDRLFVWLEEQETKYKDPIKSIIVEGFVAYVDRKRASKLKILFEFTGYLHGRLEGFCEQRGADLTEICKGKKQKIEAEMLAKIRGFSGSAHEIDAYHLGLLAGFDHER